MSTLDDRTPSPWRKRPPRRLRPVLDAPSVSPWISVSDRLPTERAIVTDGESVVFGAHYVGLLGSPGGWAVDGLRGDPTHWMPIPPLPTETA